MNLESQLYFLSTFDKFFMHYITWYTMVSGCQYEQMLNQNLFYITFVDGYRAVTKSLEKSTLFQRNEGSLPDDVCFVF